MDVDSRYVVGAVLVGTGLAVVVGLGLPAYLFQTTTAEPVEAEVLSSDVDGGCATRGVDDCAYELSVTYRFTLGGEEYTSHQVYPAAGFETYDPNRADDVAARYSAGEQVTAHVVPGDPSSSYLIEAPPSVPNVLFGAFGVVLMLAGGNGLVRTYREKSRD